MFRDCGDKSCGRREADSVKRLCLKLCENYREKLLRERKSAKYNLPVGEGADVAESVVKKAGVYGMDTFIH